MVGKPLLTVNHIWVSMSDSRPSEREEILEILASRIREIDNRLDELDPDPDDLKAQQLQIKWTRALGYLGGQYRKLVNDRDLDEMEQNMETFEHMVKSRNND